MNKTKEDFVGKKFNRLTVTRRTTPNGSPGETAWECLCDCGKTVVLPTYRVRTGKQMSCGCYRNDFHDIDPRSTKGKTRADLSGKRFGRWLCEKISHDDGVGHFFWDCKCDCGNTGKILTHSLLRGDSQSCGCLLIDNRTKHGHTTGLRNGKRVFAKEYRCWQKIKGRCLNPNDPAYANYGGRGITMYEPWQKDYVAFFNHVGKAPSAKHTLDRQAVDQGYFPGNVRWATYETQANNKRNTLYVTVAGEEIPLAMVVKNYGLRYEDARLASAKNKDMTDYVKQNGHPVWSAHEIYT